MDYLKILPESMEVLKKHNPKQGEAYSDPPIMVECDYLEGSWEVPKLVPYHNLSLDPATKVLHYAQGIFEGTKAYYVNKKGPLLFRVEDNYNRFVKSSIRSDIPVVPKNYFLDSIDCLVKNCVAYIPEESGCSLYIRPFVIATEVGLGANSSKEFKFIIIAKVAKPYFMENEEISVFLERDFGRSCKNGLGSVKTISNYAACMKIDREAKELGHKITLWLDSSEGRFVEELSGMSFFCVLDNIIYTPCLNESILPSITRDSIIALAKDMGYSVIETDIEVNELTLVNWDDCSEMFACGTTATVMPISRLVEKDGTKYEPRYSIGPITLKLKEKLLSIQEGREEDNYSWVKSIP